MVDSEVVVLKLGVPLCGVVIELPRMFLEGKVGVICEDNKLLFWLG